MPKTIDDRARSILESPNFAHVATLRKDGTPHVVPVWVDVSDGQVLLNTAEGRIWPANLRRDPRVSLTVQNTENPYEYVTIHGRVSDITPEGADEHIDRLAKKYLNKDTYPFRQPDEQRLIVKVDPERVRYKGG
jgi:PPOX class probable F420-dependent enzyme